MAGFSCCNACGKGVQIGHQVSHAKNRSRKVWKPNLNSKRVWAGSEYVRMKLCVKCVRVMKVMRLTPETRRNGYVPNARYKVMEEKMGLVS